MTVKSDLDIAQANQMEHIRMIAERLSIEEDQLEMYGKYKAKLPLNLIDEDKVQKIEFNSCISHHSYPGWRKEKTTTSIGLNEGLNRIGKNLLWFYANPHWVRFRHKGWRCRWWLLTSSANGRYQPTFYGRLFGHREGEQLIVSLN